MTVRHPAKYSDSIIKLFKEFIPQSAVILDPFGGTGKLKATFPNAICMDIEPEWAKDFVADAQHLPFLDNTFRWVVTSPTYGNRMADSFIDHKPEKQYKRNTYTHAIGRKLHPSNSGAMQFGDKYKALHIAAWKEVWRVLVPNGIFVLNISDHIRNHKIVPVTDWHRDVLTGLGFVQVMYDEVKTQRLKQGANPQRVEFESIITYRKNIT